MKNIKPKFYPVELTEEGMNPQQLEAALQNHVKFIYTIPDFQNPTGITYSSENKELLKNNDLDIHITKIKELYKKQAHAMMEAMDKYFPSTVKYTKPHGGMFLWVTLPEGIHRLGDLLKEISI